MKENCFFKRRSSTDPLLGSRGRTVHSTPHSFLIFVQKWRTNPKINLKSGIAEIPDCSEGRVRDCVAPASCLALPVHEGWVWDSTPSCSLPQLLPHHAGLPTACSVGCQPGHRERYTDNLLPPRNPSTEAREWGELMLLFQLKTGVVFFNCIC